MSNLQKYVGHIVQLRTARFKALWERARRRGQPLENMFIVSAVIRKGKKLICYGGDMCFVVSPAEVVLV